MAEFQRLGVQPWLAKQCSYMALETPTPIQRKCIPAVLAGRHVVGGAATGSGKTAAFALPILQTLAADTYGVFALVLTPSRELAYQIIDQFIAFGAPLQVRTMLAIGGVHTEAQIDALKARPHVVAATPGRLVHLLTTFAPEVKKAFAHLRFLVLDEADRLTEGDMQRDVQALLRLLPPTRQRQVLMFTATLHVRLTTTFDKAPPVPGQTEPGADAAAEEPFAVLAELGVTDPATLEVAVVQGAIHEAGADGAPAGDSATTAAAPAVASSSLVSSSSGGHVFHLPETLAQRYLFIPNMVKLPYLVAALRAQGKTQSTIVYVNSCLRAELVRLTLQLLGFPVCSLDSLLTQQHRLDNVASFKLGISRILVCTDIAARGLDIPAVGLVLHYDVPKHAETYVHRVGRTARAGREGTSVALVTEYDVSLVQRIEKRLGCAMTLWKSPAAKESAILPLLDEVSAAKIQAKQQVTEQFSTRAQSNKAHAAFKRESRAQTLAAARAARPAREETRPRHRRPASPERGHHRSGDAAPAALKRARSAAADDVESAEAPTGVAVRATKAKVKKSGVATRAAPPALPPPPPQQRTATTRAAPATEERSPARKRSRKASA